MTQTKSESSQGSRIFLISLAANKNVKQTEQINCDLNKVKNSRPKNSTTLLSFRPRLHNIFVQQIIQLAHF